MPQEGVKQEGCKIVFSTGGTGGHVYPALALSEELKSNGFETLFIGSELTSNRFLAGSNEKLVDIPAALPAWHPFKFVPSMNLIAKGVVAARAHLRAFKPDLVVGFGSYHCFPALVAAITMKIPIALHEANCMPGRVNRLLSPFALWTGVQFMDAAGRLKGNCKPMSIPLRKGLHKGSVSKQKACERYGFDPNLPVVLIFGGSQGAVGLNSLFTPDSFQEQRLKKIQWLHLTGSEGETARLKRIYGQASLKAYVADFEPMMEYAYSAADLALSRAGASTLAELTEFELPSILVPYPYASHDHQHYNASYMSNDVGGSITRTEGELNSLTVAKLINDLADSSKKLNEMRASLSYHKQLLTREPMAKAIEEYLTLRTR